MLDEFQASMTSIDTSIDNLKREQLNWFNSFEQRASGIDPPKAGFNRNPALLGVLAVGLYPFVVGDLLKIALAAVVLPSGWKLLEFGGIAGKKE